MSKPTLSENAQGTCNIPLASLRAPVQSTEARLAKVGRAPLWKHPLTMLRMDETRCGGTAGGRNA